MDPFLKIRTKMAVHGSLLHNSDQFGGSWIPATLFKIRTKMSVHGSVFKNLDQFSGLWIPASFFKNSVQNGGSWIPISKLKIRTNLAVHGYLLHNSDQIISSHPNPNMELSQPLIVVTHIYVLILESDKKSVVHEAEMKIKNRERNFHYFQHFWDNKN